MNRLLLSAAAGASGLAIGAPAAEAQIYGGLGYGAFDSDIGPQIDSRSRGEGLLARVGWKFTPLVSAEIEGYQGEAKTFYQPTGQPQYSYGLNNEFGVFAVGWIPLPNVADVFVRAGFANLSAQDGPYDVSYGTLGPAFGAGAQISLSSMIRLRAEYTSYGALDTKGITATAVMQFPAKEDASASVANSPKTGIYVGMGRASFETAIGPEPSAQSSGLLGRAGWRFNPFISAEVEGYAGGAETHYDGTGILSWYEYGLEYETGAYVVGWLPIPMVGDLFARAGSAHLGVASGLRGAIQEGEGLAYGAGVQISLAAVRLRAEYTRFEVDQMPTDGLAVTGLLQF